MKIQLKNPFAKKNADGENSERFKKIRRILIIAAVIIAVIATAFVAAKTVGNVAVSNVTDLFRKTLMSSSNGGWPLEVESLTLNEIKPVNNDILLLYNDKAQYITDKARTMGSIQYDASNSRVITNNGRSLSYDTIKGNVLLLSRTEKLGEIKSDGKIITAALSSHGNFALVTNGGENVLSKITVYSPSCKPVFEWNCADERIIDAAFSPNGKRISILAVGVQNASIYSRLTVFDTDSTEAVQNLSYEYSMMVRVFVTSKNVTMVAGDNQFIVYDKNYDRIDTLEYSEDQLNGVSFDDNGNAVLALKEFGGAQTRIYRYSAKGLKTAETTVAGEADYVRSYLNSVAVVSGRNATVLNREGQVIKTVTFESVPDKVIFTSNHFFTLEENTMKRY